MQACVIVTDAVYGFAGVVDGWTLGRDGLLVDGQERLLEGLVGLTLLQYRPLAVCAIHCGDETLCHDLAIYWALVLGACGERTCLR